MSDPCDPSTLAASAACLRQLSPKTLLAAKARALAIIAGGTTDPDELAAFTCGYREFSSGFLKRAQAMLLERKVFPTYYTNSQPGDANIIPGDPIVSTSIIPHPGANQTVSYELDGRWNGSAVELLWNIPSFLVDGSVNVGGISGSPGGDAGTLVFYGGQSRWPVRGLIIQRSTTQDNMPAIDHNYLPLTSSNQTDPYPPTNPAFTFHTSGGTTINVSGDWFANTTTGGINFDSPMAAYPGDSSWRTIKSYGPQFADQLPNSLTSVCYTDAAIVANQAYAYRLVMILGPFGIPSAGGTYYTEINWNAIVVIPPMPMTLTQNKDSNGTLVSVTVGWTPPTSIPG